MKKEWQDFIDRHNGDWDWISRLQNLSEDFIREFKYDVNWQWISAYQTFSEEFIRYFQEYVYWEQISRQQKLSEDFIREFQNKLNMKILIQKYPYMSFLQDISIAYL